MALLEVAGLTVRYGSVTAVSGVDLRIEPREIVGLLGPNGAGKTTLIDAITGFARSRGRVTFDGADVNGLPAYERSRRGIGRTFQSGELFEDLTIRENVSIGAQRVRWWSVLRDLIMRDRDRTDGRLDTTLTSLGLDSIAGCLPSEVSTGTRKIVVMARALAATPAVLLLDEPAAGLDSGESRELGTRLRAVADSGIAVLLVDHDVDLVMSVSDRVYALDFGQVIATGTPDEVRDDPGVISAYLGTAKPGA